MNINCTLTDESENWIPRLNGLFHVYALEHYSERHTCTQTLSWVMENVLKLHFLNVTDVLFRAVITFSYIIFNQTDNDLPGVLNLVHIWIFSFSPTSSSVYHVYLNVICKYQILLK